MQLEVAGACRGQPCDSEMIERRKAEYHPGAWAKGGTENRAVLLRSSGVALTAVHVIFGV